jgi:hypothetical protein
VHPHGFPWSLGAAQKGRLSRDGERGEVTLYVVVRYFREGEKKICLGASPAIPFLEMYHENDTLHLQ